MQIRHGFPANRIFLTIRRVPLVPGELSNSRTRDPDPVVTAQSVSRKRVK
jgi:hypothetical protein